jgi:hypothetical protein
MTLYVNFMIDATCAINSSVGGLLRHMRAFSSGRTTIPSTESQLGVFLRWDEKQCRIEN